MYVNAMLQSNDKLLFAFAGDIGKIDMHLFNKSERGTIICKKENFIMRLDRFIMYDQNEGLPIILQDDGYVCTYVKVV